MKRIGFLSFGHWTPSPHSETRTASDALLQSIDLAVAAEELGADGAYFRVHHFARQLGSPFPLLAAVGAKTSRIEIGTAVIDMRYENPLYMAEDAGAADLIAARPPATGDQSRLARAGRRRMALFRLPAGRWPVRRRHGASPRRGLSRRVARRRFRRAQSATDVSQSARPAARRAACAGAARPHLVGRGVRRHRRLGGREGHESAEFDAQVRRGRRCRSTSSRPSRSGRSARPGRPPGTSASRGFR